MKNNILESLSLAFTPKKEVKNEFFFAVCFDTINQLAYMKNLLSESNVIFKTLNDVINKTLYKPYHSNINVLYKVFPNEDDAKDFKHNFSMFLDYLKTSLLQNKFEPNWINNLETDISSLGIKRQTVSSFSNEINLSKEMENIEKSRNSTSHDPHMDKYNEEKTFAKNNLVNYSIKQLEDDMTNFIFANWNGFKEKSDAKSFIMDIYSIFEKQSSDFSFITKGAHLKTLRLIIKKFSLLNFNKESNEFNEDDSKNFENIQDTTDSLINCSFDFDFWDDTLNLCNDFIAKNYNVDSINIKTDSKFIKFTGVDLSYDPTYDINSRLTVDEVHRLKQDQDSSQHGQLIYQIVAYRVKMMQILQDNHYANSLIKISQTLNECSALDINNLAKETSLTKF
jgi:hypothetical protein